MQLFLHLNVAKMGPSASFPGPEALVTLVLVTDDKTPYEIATTHALWSKLLAGDGPVEAWLMEPKAAA